MTDDIAAPTGPKGIGGWLLLPMLGMVASPVILAISLKGLWDSVLVAPQFPIIQQGVIYFEFAGSLILQLIAPIWLLTLFFQTKRQFPARHILWMISSLLFSLVDLALVWTAFRTYYETAGEPFWDTETTQGLFRQIVGTAIWVPYMMNSVRVKNTFVN